MLGLLTSTTPKATLFFEESFLGGLDIYTEKINPLSPVLGGGCAQLRLTSVMCCHIAYTSIYKCVDFIIT